MHDRHSHNLLSQLPLTVSPFINLPTAVSLPYTYTPPPSHLPPSSAPYHITSATGQSSVSPNDLIEKLSVLNNHLQSETLKARERVMKWEQEIKDRELKEKRRVAPGYLDTGVVMLEPERVGLPGLDKGKGKASAVTPGDIQGDSTMRVESMSAEDARAEGVQTRGRQAGNVGEELDRAFGGMSV